MATPYCCCYTVCCYPPVSSNQLHPLHSCFCRNDLPLSIDLERIFRPTCEPPYTTNTSHRKQETYLYEYPFHWVLLPTKSQNRTLLFGSIVLKHSRHFHYRNQALNIRMGVCYPDCHKAGLCCYLVIRIKTHYVQSSYFISVCDLFTDYRS
jgi:hypothetical protein